jgi:hypothetical protein
MALNYALLVITAILSITGGIGMVRGGVFGSHPLRTIAAAIVFVITLVATLAGIDYLTFRTMIEHAFSTP